MLLRSIVQTATDAGPARCATCGDGCGWVRWQRERRAFWASCADCNLDAAKPKPLLCPTCAVTFPFCTCLARLATG